MALPRTVVHANDSLNDFARAQPEDGASLILREVARLREVGSQSMTG
jgi:hypothetical protein